MNFIAIIPIITCSSFQSSDQFGCGQNLNGTKKSPACLLKHGKLI